jgi:hypothetical protein
VSGENLWTCFNCISSGPESITGSCYGSCSIKGAAEGFVMPPFSVQKEE